MSYSIELPKIKEDFISNFKNGKLAVNCRTRREAVAFLMFLREEGLKWCNGDEIDRIDKEGGYYDYDKDTCYTTYPNNEGVGLGSLQYYLQYGDEKPVINYKDILEVENLGF